MKKFFTFVVVLAAIGGGAWLVARDNDDAIAPADNSATATPAATSTAATSSVSSNPADRPKALTYKDGTYTSVGTYGSPAGSEKISITLTIKGGIVTSASAINQAGDSKSKRYQDLFISGFQAAVVGKNLGSIANLTKVSGSSLTPAGFNAALQSIRVQAQA